MGLHRLSGLGAPRGPARAPDPRPGASALLPAGLGSPAATGAALGAILMVGAAVRLYRLDLTWYFLDQVRDVSTGAGIAAGTDWPLVGGLVGHTHGRLGPLFFYLVAPVFLVSRDPLAAVIGVALANVLAIFLCYRFARTYFGAPVALTAAALFAVFPLAVISSRVLWNPALVPLFTLLFMRCLFAVVVDGRSVAMVGVLGLLGALTQIHLSTVALAAVAAAGWLLFRPRVQLRHVAWGLALALGLYFPYLVYEWSHGFENLRAFLSPVGLRAGPAGEWALPAMVRNLSILFRPVLDGFVVGAPWAPAFASGFSALYAVEAALFVLGVLVALGRLAGVGIGAAPGPSRRALTLLLLWIAVPVLVLGASRTAMWWYYLDVLYPGQFILAGLGLTWVAGLRWGPPVLRTAAVSVAVALVVALVAVQAFFQIGLQRRIDRDALLVFDVPTLSISPEGSPFGALTSLPLGYRRQILRTLLEDFAVDPRALLDTVHGPVLGLPSESEYLVRHLADATDARPPAATRDGAHYLVVRDRPAGASPSGRRRAEVGPYAVVEYVPAIDYGSWRYAVAPGGALDQIPAGAWVRQGLPASSLGIALGAGQALVWAGRLREVAGRPVDRVAVHVIGDQLLEVREAWLDGARLEPVARHSGQSPSLYWDTQAVFELPPGSRTGDRPLMISIVGEGRVLSVDVWEAHAS